MCAPSAPLRRGPFERVSAWLLTGPLGHLWSVVADLTSYLVKWLAGGARRRLAQRRVDGAGRPPSARR